MLLAILQDHKGRRRAYGCGQCWNKQAPSSRGSSKGHLRASGSNHWQAQHVFVGLLSLLVREGSPQHHCCCWAVNCSAYEAYVRCQGAQQ
jgi:hypothetical protein